VKLPSLGIVAGLVALAFSACKKQEPFEILQPPPTPALQKFWQLPDFSLTERSGNTMSLADLKGKVWVADFFYTTCPGPCPMMTSRLSALQDKLAGKTDVRLVSISLDPEKDTPDVLRQYAERFKAGPDWLFFTGDKAAIRTLSEKGFKLAAVEERNSPEPIIHSTKLVLVDREGWVRGIYEAIGEDQTAKIVTDIEKLLTQQP
jgi:protein SCO1